MCHVNTQLLLNGGSGPSTLCNMNVIYLTSLGHLSVFINMVNLKVLPKFSLNSDTKEPFPLRTDLNKR